MSHKPPLHPKKKEACGDVRPLLAEVFRAAPPTPHQPTPPTPADAAQNRTAYKNNAEIQNLQIPEDPLQLVEIRNQADELRNEYCKQLCRRARAADYELSYCGPPPPLLCAFTHEDAEFDVIRRQDLIPTTLENSDQLRCRWLMTKTSSGVGADAKRAEDINIQAGDVILSPKDFSIQSISSGEAGGAPPAPRPQRPPRPPRPLPCCVVCEPSTLNFVNFTVGHDHVRTLRVVNTSRHAVRLALRPPARPDLRLELPPGLARGLALSSGAGLQLRLHFKPRDVRAFRDEVMVRVSRGAPAAVPVLCYLEPPLLDVIVPRAEVGAGWGGLLGRGAVPARSPVLDLGARLAGAPHRVPLRLACTAHHAAFYVMTEEAWCSFTLDEDSIRTGYVVSGAFSVGPAYWAGGECGGLASHRAPTPGLRSAALRLLSSTAVVRPLTIVADSIMFSIDHITLQTPEKDYDILLEGDPTCPYHVHLGSAFPERPLAATVHLLNHSAVPYSYYWSVRPWDKILLSAEKRHSEVFSDVIESDLTSLHTESVSAIRVEPVRGVASARSVTAVHVCAPRAGADCGLHRLVLMLVLTDIPEESLGPEYEDYVLSTKSIEEEEIPGLCQAWSRAVCEVLVTQMEVWWEVVPLRFVLHPPVIQLTHTKRVSAAELQVEVTQLHAGGEARVAWRGDVQSLPPLAPLEAGRSVRHRLRLPLPAHGEPTNNIFQLEASEGEWRAWCVVTSRCAPSRAALLPACRRLDAAPPAAALAATLTVCNDTFNTITWRVNIYPWWCLGGARCAAGVAAGAAGSRCAVCASSCCACGSLSPAAGELPHAHTDTVTYHCHAPAVEGSVVNIVQLRTGQAESGAAACSALLAHRAMRPRLLLRTLRCGCPRPCNYEGCPAGGDAGCAGSSEGCAVLRPRRALRVGHAKSYRLRCINMTPVSTGLCWEVDKQCEDALRVTFSPAECEVAAFATVFIEVSLRAVSASARRVRAYRAAVRHADAPLYLLVDTAVDGRKVSIDIPTGDEAAPVATVTRSEVSKYGDPPQSSDNTSALSPDEIFTDFEQKRTQLTAAEIAVGTAAETALESEAETTEGTAVATAVEAAAGTTQATVADTATETAVETETGTEAERAEEAKARGGRACTCYAPLALPRHAPLCLQFTRVPVGSVQWQQVALNNAGELPLRWSAQLRRWPHSRAPALLHGQCVEEVGAGVGLQCAPGGGALRPGGAARLALGVRAHTWGLYRDQLLLQMDSLEPVVLDVWVQVVGAPLQFALRPTGHRPDQHADTPVLWMSRADAARRLLLYNRARCGLHVRTLLLKDHECGRDALPLRVYVRFYDVQREELPLQGRDGYIMSFEEDSSCRDLSEDHIGTGIELIISADYGLQVETVFEVEPKEFDIPGGGRASLAVRVRAPLAPPAPAEFTVSASLVLLSQPVQRCGEGWYRPDPPPQMARLRLDEQARLQLSRDCLRAQLSALHLPPDGVIRVRKYLQALNVGAAALVLRAVTEAPWSVSVSQAGSGECVAGCGEGSQCLLLQLPARTSVRLCCELALPTAAVWPEEGEAGEERVVTEEGAGDGAGLSTAEQVTRSVRADTEVKFYDADEVLVGRVSLRAVVELPALRARPVLCDFGFVALDDCRKTYFTVSHTSTVCALEAVVQCEGEQFAAWPTRLSLAPHAAARVYVQYTAKRVEAGAGAGVEAWGAVCVRAAGAAGRWCSANVTLRAAGTRDCARALPVHDHTDDDHLLPTSILNITYNK